jgi:Asp-tRNA(Asn)/Glu-tRNA(Gln) amidotransferase A subunit family amidase
MKPIEFSRHAREQMAERGTDKDEVAETIRAGERVPAKRGRQGYRRNFQYNRLWGGRTYAIKQVFAVVAEETDVLVVVTVYTFYF